MTAIIPATIAKPIAFPSEAVSETVVPIIADELAVDKRDSLTEKRSYASTCNSCTIGGTAMLMCSCRNNAGVWGSSSIWLDTYIANVNGVLRWQLHGGYGSSCSFKSFYGSTSTLRCSTMSGLQVDSSIDLNQKIHNINGQLQCHLP
ncbi:Cyanovirin-N [Naviculisporaceae sp. PSN 640]